MLNSKYFDDNRFKGYENKISIIEKKDEEHSKIIKNHQALWKNQLKPLIEKWFQDNKIAKSRFQDIYNVITTPNEKETVKELENYFKRKKIYTSILNQKEVVAWREQFINLLNEQKKINNERYECLNPSLVDDLKRIFPKKPYNVLPLKDRYKGIEFEDLNNNELLINFEFSNNGLSDFYYYYDIIKMDYKFRIDKKIIEKKDIFIKNQHEDDNCKPDYYEKDNGEIYKLIKVPFNARPYSNPYISTTMELCNGINEYTLMNKEKYKLKDILDEINDLINPYTSIKISLRHGMKNKCKSYIDSYYQTNNLLKDKMLTSIDQN